jgi:hypothetical protein
MINKKGIIVNIFNFISLCCKFSLLSQNPAQAFLILKKSSFLSFFLLLLLPISIQAQMFSVGEAEDRPPLRLQSYSTVGVALEFADFDFTGSDLAPDEQAEFSGNILRLRVENPGLDISVGLGGTLTGIDDRSYVNVNAHLYNDFPLVRSEKFIFAIPIQIGTDLKSVQIERSNNNFQQSSFTIGAGLSMRYQINRRVGASFRGTPNYGFSFSQGNLFGGSLFKGLATARLYFNEVFGSSALVFGYDFDYRDYDIDGTQNDYRYNSHSVTIGLAF